NGRILIVNTASGIVGEDTSMLCGSMLLGWLHACIAEQAEHPPAQRTPIYVFLDEMQKFPSVNLNAILAELRKYGGNFALATQSFEYLDALDKTLRATLTANTDQLFAFDMSAPDATAMAEEIGDGIHMEDIVSLDNYECYAKLTLAGAHLPAFSLRLLPPPEGDPLLVKALLEKSARIYGCPVQEVDRQIRLQEQVGDKKTPGGASTSPSRIVPIDDDQLSPDFDRIERNVQIREASFDPMNPKPPDMEGEENR
ncbi:MAG: type IV secretion system DNA-binding domain-containing protein, partial [Ktedonobacteraceae bacterium]|nr:type IV secretion system DNA-binding domain-containing protein [Ktedonobacteraceae bacterium]